MILFISVIATIQAVTHIALKHRPLGIAFLVSIALPLIFVWTGSMLQYLSAHRNGWEIIGAITLSVAILVCGGCILAIRLVLKWYN